jgi:hypothetical protein
MDTLYKELSRRHINSYRLICKITKSVTKKTMDTFWKAKQNKGVMHLHYQRRWPQPSAIYNGDVKTPYKNNSEDNNVNNWNKFFYIDYRRRRPQPSWFPKRVTQSYESALEKTIMIKPSNWKLKTTEAFDELYMDRGGRRTEEQNQHYCDIQDTSFMYFDILFQASSSHCTCTPAPWCH